MQFPIDVTEASIELGTSRSTVVRWLIRLGRGKKIGNAWMLTATDLRAVKKNFKKSAGNPNFSLTKKRQ